MMTPLITLDEAKAQLLIPLADVRYDTELLPFMAAATHSIVIYLDAPTDPGWTAETTPDAVKQAIKILLGHQWTERGDFAANAGAEEIWMAIGHLLVGLRHPAMA
jgi:hypothetical protein